MPGTNEGQQGSMNSNPKQSGLSWSQPSSAKSVSSILGAAGGQPKNQPPKPPMPAEGGGSRKLLLSFAAGVVVGGLLTWSWFSLTPTAMVEEADGGLAPTTGQTTSGTSLPSSNTSGGAASGAVISSDALVVSSPQMAGLSVRVSSASVTSPTWIVVYESQNGARGNALGAALFFPDGGGDNVINLLRATTPGRTYLVGRHVDNGDKQFSLTNDRAVVNAAGNPVYVEFRTQ